MKSFLFSTISAMVLLSAGILSAQPYPSNESAYAMQNSSTQKVRWLSNYSEAVALSQSTSKPIAILFTGTGWCPACIKLEREVIGNPEFSAALGQKFVFLKAEFPDYSEGAVMASPFKPLLDRYEVKEFPTIVVINANGQLLQTVRYRQGGPQAYIQELLRRPN